MAGMPPQRVKPGHGTQRCRSQFAVASQCRSAGGSWSEPGLRLSHVESGRELRCRARPRCRSDSQIGQIACESKAGLFGTFVLFLVLALGILGFVAKAVIQWVLDV